MSDAAREAIDGLPAAGPDRSETEQSATVRIAALLTCHNRRPLTVSTVRALASQATDAHIDVVLHDDGSTDGTADAVREACPDATVLEGDGSRYWCGGMVVAWQHALEQDYDHYLWVNDDSVLDADAVAILLATARQHPSTVVVGAMRDPMTGDPTYGGVVRSSAVRRLRYTMVDPAPTVQPVDSMNGNCVLVPREVVQRIGILDDGFTHGLGDYDYGLRARRAGLGVVQVPGTVGTCSRNEEPPPAPRGFRTAVHEWRRLRGIKVIPSDEWRRFARRHAGPMWPVFWISPYVRGAFRRGLRG